MKHKSYWDIENMYGYMVDCNGQIIESEIHFRNRKEMMSFVSICLNNCIEFGICSYRESDELMKANEEGINGMD